MSNNAPSSLATAVPNVSNYLSCVQVVMVNTTLPANIGSAARAMHTMGLSRLTVVDPKLPIDDTSVSHAAGGSDLLSSAIIAPTLESAIADCQLVFAPAAVAVICRVLWSRRHKLPKSCWTLLISKARLTGTIVIQRPILPFCLGVKIVA